MAAARDRNGYTPCETVDDMVAMDTSTTKLKDTSAVSVLPEGTGCNAPEVGGCRPGCRNRNLRQLASEAACAQCEYETQLDSNGYAHFDVSTYTPTYHYRYGSPREHKQCPSTWKIVVLVLTVAVLFIAGLIAGYYVGRSGNFRVSIVQ